MGSFPVIDPSPDENTPRLGVARLVSELVRLGRLPPELRDEATEAIWRRESLGSTAIGSGVAIPHARIVAVEGVIGRCARPFEWTGAIDDRTVGLVCLLLTGSSVPELEVIEMVVRQLRN